MDVGLAILTAIIGSTGVFSFVQYLISRHDNKDKDLADIKRQLNTAKKVQYETILRVTRLELKGLIRDDPTNKDAILQVAQYYFVDLDGNGYMHALFEQWAKKYDVPTNWLPKVNKERKGK